MFSNEEMVSLNQKDIDPTFKWSDRLHGSVEPWWIFIEDSENECIYHTEYFLLHK
jgi:hypothetical protein